ncbi:MAG: hypothetical protein ACRELY_04860 [Polyangiaceae bacterium]
MIRTALGFAAFVALSIVACTEARRPRSPTAEVRFVLAEDPLDASVPSDINVEANRVVIQDPAPDIAGAYRGYWHVSDHDAQHADEGVEGYVRSKRAEIADKLGDYDGQIFGIIDESGRKLIHFNFLCTRGLEQMNRIDSEHPELTGRATWQHHVLLVNDGGDCYFHLDFDPETGEYEGLTVNGDA